jgi:hypothetical protein
MATPVLFPLVAVNPSPGSKTVQMPSAFPNKGRIFTIYDSDGNANIGLGRTITINTIGGDIFENGSPTIVIGAAYSSISLISNGISTWYVLSRGNNP